MSEAQTDAISMISGVAISGHTNTKESIAEIVYDTPLTHGKLITIKEIRCSLTY
jgi:hypothetical protein